MSENIVNDVDEPTSHSSVYHPPSSADAVQRQAQKIRWVWVECYMRNYVRSNRVTYTYQITWLLWEVRYRPYLTYN